MNIISQIGANKEDYIRFYAGKDADGTTPNIHIHGTGTTKGFVGINTENPTKRLHISGDTLSEGDIYLPDDYKLRIGNGGDLLIYHDALNTYIAEVGSGNLLLSGTELRLNYTSTSGGGTITIGDSNTLPVGFKTELIRTSTTTAATVGSAGTSTINGSSTKALPTAVYSVTTCIANGNVWYCSTGTIL